MRFKEFLKPKSFLLALKRREKRVILALNDAIISMVALWLAFVLRIGPPEIDHLWGLVFLFALVPICSVLFFWFFGFYNYLLRELELRNLTTIGLGVVATGLVIAGYGYFHSAVLIPRSIPVLFAIVAFLLIGASRIFGRWYYRQAVGLHKDSQPIIIYGAGETGINTANTLEYSREFSLIGFIDDDKGLQGSRVKGRKIHAIDELEHLSSRHKNLRVLICIANITSEERRRIIEKLQAYAIQVLTIPPLSEVVAGRAKLDDLKEVRLQDLLGREQVPPIKEFFQQAIEGKVVLVSGAGGSIGSEICMQLASNNPAKVVAIDNSEFALYQLEQKILKTDPDLLASGVFLFLLCNVQNSDTVKRIMQEHKPDVVYHAAAYKHVPIVERQPLRAMENNILGTQIVASAAAEVGASHFILVSTDKAVRPTNVMGATKRVAELVVQAMAQRKGNTIYSSVRFGNVLGSSGSVIPLFRKQIAVGGPVTVTHPDVTRYFMTIPEAAQLVMQAGFLAKGGDVFVLDMGEPVQIQKLARLMIQLSGKTAKDKDNPGGDIEIAFTGLRPGEKLYEELLLTENAEGTIHPKIMVANEASLPPKAVDKHISAFKSIIAKDQNEKGVELLEQLVEGFIAEKNRRKS